MALSSTPAISGSGQVASMLAAASSEIVHIFGIGDSNQIRSGSGHDNGYQDALHNAGYRMFSTGFQTPNTNSKNGYNIGWNYSESFLDIGSISGQIAEHLEVTGPSGLWTPCVLADEQNESNGNGGIGIYIYEHPQRDEQMSWECLYGTFSGTFVGAGLFRPSARYGESPWSGQSLTDNSDVNSITGTNGVAWVRRTLAANPGRDKRIQIGYTRPGAPSIQGPFFSAMNRVLFDGENRGFAYTTISFRGGQSARVAADEVQNMRQGFFREIFGRARQDAINAGQTPKVIIAINHGLNCRNETNTSLGPSAYTDGDSPEAQLDNIKAIVNEYESRWLLEGWSLSELGFILQVSHPVSVSLDSELESYRAAQHKYANSRDRVLFVNPAAELDHDHYQTNGWYNGSDKVHLASSGYNGEAAWKVNAITNYVEPENDYDDIVTDSQLFLPFQEDDGVTAFDASGNSRNGGLTALNFSTDSVAGPTSFLPRALRRTAAQSTAKVTVADHPDLRGGGRFTIACWVTLENGKVFPFTKGLDTNTKDWMLWRYEPGNANPLAAMVENGTGDYILSDSHPSGSWVHMAFSYDNATGDSRFYLNGQLAQQSTSANRSASTNAPITLFMLQYQTSPPYVGSIAGAGMWSKVLAPTEIDTLYNGPSTSKPWLYKQNSKVLSHV